MLEHAVEGGDVADQRGGDRIEAEHDHGHEELQQHLHHHLERMEDHGAGNVDPLRAVVDLVEAAPQEANVVSSPVPGVDDAAQDEVAGRRAAGDA